MFTTARTKLVPQLLLGMILLCFPAIFHAQTIEDRIDFLPNDLPGLNDLSITHQRTNLTLPNGQVPEKVEVEGSYLAARSGGVIFLYKKVSNQWTFLRGLSLSDCSFCQEDRPNDSPATFFEYSGWGEKFLLRDGLLLVGYFEKVTQSNSRGPTELSYTRFFDIEADSFKTGDAFFTRGLPIALEEDEGIFEDTFFVNTVTFNNPRILVQRNGTWDIPSFDVRFQSSANSPAFKPVNGFLAEDKQQAVIQIGIFQYIFKKVAGEWENDTLLIMSPISVFPPQPAKASFLIDDSFIFQPFTLNTYSRQNSSWVGQLHSGTGDYSLFGLEANANYTIEVSEVIPMEIRDQKMLAEVYLTFKDAASQQNTFVYQALALFAFNDNNQAWEQIQTLIPISDAGFRYDAPQSQMKLEQFSFDGNSMAGIVDGQLFVIEESGLQPPLAPTDLTVMEEESLYVFKLNWVDKSLVEDGYVVEKKENGSNIFTTIATLAANQTSYEDLNFDFTKTYTYRVKAFNSAGNSPYSNEVSASLPQTVRNLRLTALCSSDPSISREWNVRNPNGFAVPAIWAQWYSSARDTVVFPPGHSSFSTASIPGDNTVGLYWSNPNNSNKSSISRSSNVSCARTQGEELLLIQAVPTAFNQAFVLNFHTDIQETLTMNIFNSLGQLVKTQKFAPASAIKIFAGNLPKGIYHVEILEGIHRDVIQVVKQ